jgi:CRP/FNR family transcriptional regulator
MSTTNQRNWCSSELADVLSAKAELIQMPKGSTIMSPGDDVNGAFILQKGTVKLFRVFESGEKHLLYLLHENCMCALSSLTGLLGEKIPVLAEAEEDIEVQFIPQEEANRLFLENEEWRSHILNGVFKSWKESMSMLDQVTFKPLQRRLEQYLAQHASLSERRVVQKSHAEIAAELNVSREAVSRVLKVMENQDAVHLGHGSIKVISVKP